MEGHKHIADVISRLSKIEGHIKGIKKMLEDGKPCDEVLIQFSAVKSAISRASLILFEDHFNHCILEKITDKDLAEDMIEFKKSLEQFIKIR